MKLRLACYKSPIFFSTVSLQVAHRMWSGYPFFESISLIARLKSALRARRTHIYSYYSIPHSATGMQPAYIDARSARKQRKNPALLGYVIPGGERYGTKSTEAHHRRKHRPSDPRGHLPGHRYRSRAGQSRKRPGRSRLAGPASPPPERDVTPHGRPLRG